MFGRQEAVVGRGAGFNPHNRFEELRVEAFPDDSVADGLPDAPPPRIETKFYVDSSKSILAVNDSPDLGFRFSINPYRGCEHGCVYCYARPSHEYLGFSSGLDFESKIMVKLDAAKLLDDEFAGRSWKPETIVFSGNTDCYQPVERNLELTRKCLQVFLKYRNPVSMITKNALIQRDIDLLRELASVQCAFVIISVTTLRQSLVRKMEPRTSSPARRLETIELLARNGVPVGVNVAPIIPGLNDMEIPSILRAAADHGARWAGHTLLRLPYALKDLFIEWIKREYPEQAAKVLNRIRGVRGGKLSESEFGKRMTGEGELARSIQQLFQLHCRKHSLNTSPLKLSTEHFVRPSTLQQSLF